VSDAGDDLDDLVAGAQRLAHRLPCLIADTIYLRERLSY
jgi:hypothetical protein